MQEKIRELLKAQINHELYSAYIYLDFSHFFSTLGLDGFSHYFRVQAKEETEHALMFLDYLEEVGEKVTFGEIAKVEMHPEEISDVLHAALEHERYITGLIYKIYEAAEEEKDYRTRDFLSGFIREQREEEKLAGELLAKMKIYGTDTKGLYLLNSELKQRCHEKVSAR